MATHPPNKTDAAASKAANPVYVIVSPRADTRKQKAAAKIQCNRTGKARTGVPNGRGETSDGRLEEIDDASPEHRQLAPQDRGMIRNNLRCNRHAGRRQRGMGTGALAIERFAAIRSVTVVGRHFGGVTSAVRRNDPVARRHGFSPIGFMAVAWHGRCFRCAWSLGHDLGNYCHVTCVCLHRMRHRRHNGLPEEQYGKQGRHGRS